MNKTLLITDLFSPLLREIKDSTYDSYTVGAAIPNFKDYEYIFDFTTLGKIEKQALFNELTHNCSIYSELTCFDSQFFYKKYSNLKGSFSTLFLTDKRKIEFHTSVAPPLITDVLKSLNIEPVFISESGIGFIYPRTLAQIVNEAYFALEEEVATATDIDRAMKFGVNYPNGPIEWCKNKERYIVTILEELKNKFSGNRYNISKLLLKKAGS